MPLVNRARTCSHLLILAWAITWVTTVPLFHTHLPDVNDGSPPRQGLAHTVFSPDLPGEFSHTHGGVLHLSTSTQNLPELGFVISIQSADTTCEAPSALYIYSSCVTETPLVAEYVPESHDRPPKPNPSLRQQSSRSPPLIVF